MIATGLLYLGKTLLSYKVICAHLIYMLKFQYVESIVIIDEVVDYFVSTFLSWSAGGTLSSSPPGNSILATNFV